MNIRRAIYDDSTIRAEPARGVYVAVSGTTATAKSSLIDPGGLPAQRPSRAQRVAKMRATHWTSPGYAQLRIWR